MEVQTGREAYAFLRDQPSGYIRQVSGPAKAVTVANLGAIPLRVDTFLGKFTVHAGSALRLDGNAPQREKRKALLLLRSQCGQPLLSAELWDGFSWRRLNIKRFDGGERGRFAVLDGRAIVQYLEIDRKREIYMMDSPEPDPDYEIYAAAQPGDWVTLRFNRSDFWDGQVVQRRRTIPQGGWGRPVIYDLQKLRDSPTESAVRQCAAQLPGLTEEAVLPDDWTEDFAPKRARPPFPGKLRESLGEESGGQLQEPGQAERQGDSGAASCGREAPRTGPDRKNAPVPEPPGNFPE